MNEQNTPATEAAEFEQAETASYEFAFHILPTVAEGEVANEFQTIKSRIETHGAQIFDEEAPERFDLAYEIVKYLEGRNRSFSSAYFGWVRFELSPSNIEALEAELGEMKSILRSLTLRLTKSAVANPFYFHDALRAEDQVTEIDDEAVAQASDAAETPEPTSASEASAEAETSDSTDAVTADDEAAK